MVLRVQQLPQAGERIDTAGEAAAHADDGDLPPGPCVLSSRRPNGGCVHVQLQFRVRGSSGPPRSVAAIRTDSVEPRHGVRAGPCSTRQWLPVRTQCTATDPPARQRAAAPEVVRPMRDRALVKSVVGAGRPNRGSPASPGPDQADCGVQQPWHTPRAAHSQEHERYTRARLPRPSRLHTPGGEEYDGEQRLPGSGGKGAPDAHTPRLHTLLQEADWSGAQLATALRKLADEHAQRLACDRSTVSRWLGGTPPGPPRAGAVAAGTLTASATARQRRRGRPEQRSGHGA